MRNVKWFALAIVISCGSEGGEGEEEYTCQDCFEDNCGTIDDCVYDCTESKSDGTCNDWIGCLEECDGDLVYPCNDACFDPGQPLCSGYEDFVLAETDVINEAVLEGVKYFECSVGG